MQKGFNSDLVIQGRTYHIQTEDWGFDNPYLVTRVFLGGAVIKTVKKSYSEALPPQTLPRPEYIQRALREQHTEVLGLLRPPL